jgi:alpha-galactosidase
VVAIDGLEALYSFSCLRSAEDEVPGSVVLPGLDPQKRYRVAIVFPAGAIPDEQRNTIPWTVDSVVASGSFLSEVGLPMPVLLPEHAIVLHASAVED